MPSPAEPGWPCTAHTCAFTSPAARLPPLCRRSAYACLRGGLAGLNYTAPLAAWLEAFPRGQVLLLQHESLVAPDTTARHLSELKRCANTHCPCLHEACSAQRCVLLLPGQPAGPPRAACRHIVHPTASASHARLPCPALPSFPPPPCSFLGLDPALPSDQLPLSNSRQELLGKKVRRRGWAGWIGQLAPHTTCLHARGLQAAHRPTRPCPPAEPRRRPPLCPPSPCSRRAGR